MTLIIAPQTLIDVIAIVVLAGLAIAIAIAGKVKSGANESDYGKYSNSKHTSFENKSCGVCNACGVCSVINSRTLAQKEQGKNVQIEYFDDEELDVFIGRKADNYTKEETQIFRNILITLLPKEIEDWQISLKRRGIAIPNELKNEIIVRKNIS